MYVTSILNDVRISREGGRKWGLGKQTRMILGVPLTCLQVELNFFHEHEARAVDFLCFCGKSDRESESSGTNYRNRK